MRIYEIFVDNTRKVFFEEQAASGASDGGSDSGTDGGNSSGSTDIGSNSDSKTSTGDVSTVIFPLGSMISRPYFNYIRPSKKRCKHGTNKDDTCKKKSGKKS